MWEQEEKGKMRETELKYYKIQEARDKAIVDSSKLSN
jgi:hypothetical protein